MIGIPTSRAENPIRNNILIRRDWAAVKRGCYRSREVWAVLAAGIVLLIACIVLRIRGIKDDVDLFNCSMFAAFHFFIHFIVPYSAYRIARQYFAADEGDALRVTPIPQNHIFWWLWSRAFFPAMAILLIFYLPLNIPYGWLHAVGSPPVREKGELEPAWARYVGELICDGAVIGLILVPWIDSRRLRRTILGAAIIGLFILPIFWSQFGLTILDKLTKGIDGDRRSQIFRDLLLGRHEPLYFFASYARLHSLITLFYFLTSVAWSSGIGVAVGLRRGRDTGRALLLLFLFGPAPEWAILHLPFLDEASALYDGWMSLWAMLLFYSFSFGLVWMGIKWNLLIYLSRKRFGTE